GAELLVHAPAVQVEAGGGQRDAEGRGHEERRARGRGERAHTDQRGPPRCPLAGPRAEHAGGDEGERGGLARHGERQQHVGVAVGGEGDERERPQPDGGDPGGESCSWARQSDPTERHRRAQKGSLREIGRGTWVSTAMTPPNAAGAKTAPLSRPEFLTAMRATSSLLMVSGASSTCADIRVRTCPGRMSRTSTPCSESA